MCSESCFVKTFSCILLFAMAQSFVSFKRLFTLVAIILFISLSYDSVDARGASGRSSGRSSSSRSSSSRSSWGSSRSSGRSSYSSPSRSSWSSPSRSSSWGSSSPSGSSRSSWSSSPSRGYVSSSSGSSPWGSSISTRKTGISIAGNAAIKSAASRPRVNVPAPSYKVQPAPAAFATHTTIVNNNYIPGSSRNLLLSNSNGYVNGYLLGTMMERTRYRNSIGCCYGCGCYYGGVSPPWYYHSYVPYRYSYAINTSSSVISNTTTYSNSSSRVPPNIAPVSPCTLQRWNMELPFTELPNMILTFLSSDNISGSSILEKSRFVYELVNASAESYGSLPNGSHVFDIPTSADLSLCNFQLPWAKLSAFIPATTVPPTGTTTVASTTTDQQYYKDVAKYLEQLRRNSYRTNCKLLKGTSLNIPECAEFVDDPSSSASEEPIYTGVQRVLSLYSNQSSDQTMLTELVSSARHCFGNSSGKPSEALMQCLDFSISANKVLELDVQKSIFGNDADVCRRFLNPDIQRCADAAVSSSFLSCSKDDLVNVLVFVRNFYVCNETLDSSLISKLESQQPVVPLTGVAGYDPNYGDATFNVSGSDRVSTTGILSLVLVFGMAVVFSV